MKIYEKPMATVEMVEVEDVITASIVDLTAEEVNAIKQGAGIAAEDNLIVFQW